MAKVPDNILRPPVVPKIKDIDTERAITEIVRALKEAQEQIRKLIEAQP